MSSVEVWEVRFPDGRAVRGLDTDTLRRRIQAGKVPVGSVARRAGEDEWVALEWLPEFAAALADRPRPTPSPEVNGPPRRTAPAGELVSVAERLEAAELGTLGVGGVLREVTTALDVTLLPGKLTFLAVLGGLAGLLVALPTVLFALPEWAFWVQLGVLALLLAFGAATVSQAVYVELSRHRRARPKEVRRGLFFRTLRLFVGFVVHPGLAIAVAAGLFWLAGWLLGRAESAPQPLGYQFAAQVAAVLALISAVKVIIFGPLALLLAPVLVVEECGLVRALGQWWRLLRENLPRSLLYELLATGVLLLFLAVPAVLVLALGWLPIDPRHGPLVVVVQGVLGGALAALAVGYLVVVQVFLYLNLRFVEGK